MLRSHASGSHGTRRRYARGALLVAALVALTTAANAQSVRAFETIDQGLPSVRASGGAQLADGRMAFACDAGLATYDGRAWEVDARVLEIVRRPRLVALDGEGRPWVTGQRSETPLAHFVDGAWQALPSPGSAPARMTTPLALEVLPDGRLLYATGAGVWLHDGDGWVALATREELGGIVRAVQRVDESIVIGSEAGLATWRAGTLSTWPLPEELANSTVIALAVDPGPQERLWIVGSTWVAHTSGGRLEVVARGQATFDVESLHTALADGVDGLWIGARAGMWHVEDGRVRAIRRDTHVQTWPGVNGLLRDREGVLWIAHDRGVHRVPSARFEVWRRLDGLLQDDVTAIVESPPGRVVFAHPEGLSFLQDGRVRTRRLETDILQPKRILSLAPDRAGNLWIARSRGGALRVTPDGDVTGLALPDEAFATSMLVDGRDRVWLTTFQGLYRWSGERFEPVDDPSCPDGLRRVLELADGRMALATAFCGIALLEPDGWRTVSHPDGDLADSTYDVLLREDGTLLVASDVGLLCERDGELVRWSEGRFALDESVYALLEHRGELWAGTRDGVVRWDGERARRYGHAQGLAGQEINRAGLLVDSRGRLWIGGVGGASRYRPEFDRPDLVAPRLSLTAVMEGGTTWPPDRPLRLEHERDDLEFAFHAISFADSGRVAYRFRLHGYDPDWIEDPRVSEGGVVRYTNLPPGDYRFEVAARAGSAPWGASVSSAEVRIVPPFWHTGWFGALAVGLLAALGWGANHLLLQRRRNAQLDALVRARTEELVAAERGYREVFERSRAPQLLVDGREGTIHAANPAAEALLGLPSSELVGAPFARFLVPADDAEPLDLRRIDPGQGRRFECALRTADGEVREVELYAASHELAGRATVQVLLHDVTEQRRLQEQLAVAQRMESIGLLAGGIAHDFNNLLTVILGNAELALGELDPEDATSAPLERELLQIRESGQRAAGLTRQLLEFSRKRVVRFEPLDLNAIVRELEPIARRLTREDVALALDLDEGLAPILAERSQVEQVVLNLVVNAAEAMPRGGTTTIRTRPVELPGDSPGAPADLRGRFARLEVSDTGVGMDAATAARVFEPFFSRKPLGVGTGLGLATLHGIVEQAGGRVEVDSLPGAGTTFRVWLPVAVEPAAATPAPRPASPTAGSETILLCEDDEALRTLATRLLTSAGYRVLPAGVPSRALELAEDTAQGIDLLLTDVILPERNGRELAEAVLALRPGLPVLYVSGYTADVIARHGMLGPETELLHKPFRAPELLRRVRELLDRAAETLRGAGAP